MTLPARAVPAAAAKEPPVLTDADFASIQSLLLRISGIHLSEFKRTLVMARLGGRLRERGLASFTAYFQLLKAPGEALELQTALDLLTTNETYFFREPEHFEILRQYLASLRPVPSPFRVWSAASSSGEEAYSIAMVLADAMGGAPWEVLGSDLSTRVLARAETGLYHLERNEGIPPNLLKRYCLKGQGAQAGMMLMTKALTDHTRFTQVNLNLPLPDLGSFDVVFLRNILIYFQPDQKRKVVEAVVTKMKPRAILIVGHSESLMGLTSRVEQVRPTVYRVA